MSIFDQEIEAGFIREFSVGGNQIGLSTNPEERRERIRVAIYANRLHDKIYHDSGITYAAMYRLCYGRAMEMRRWPRAIAAESVPKIEDATNDDGEDDESDAEPHPDLIE